MTHTTNNVKANIMNFLRMIGTGNEFHGWGIVAASLDHPLSATRLLRQLRQEGKINYVCTNKRKSEYKLLFIKEK